jgi:hypothetical protein
MSISSSLQTLSIADRNLLLSEELASSDPNLLVFSSSRFLLHGPPSNMLNDWNRYISCLVLSTNRHLCENFSVFALLSNLKPDKAKPPMPLTTIRAVMYQKQLGQVIFATADLWMVSNGFDAHAI